MLDGQTTKPLSVSSRKSNTPNDSHGLNSELEAHDLNGRSNVSDVFVSCAKLLNNLEKSYDSGKKILDESKIADESTDFRKDAYGGCEFDPFGWAHGESVTSCFCQKGVEFDPFKIGVVQPFSLQSLYQCVKLLWVHAMGEEIIREGFGIIDISYFTF